MTALLNPRWAHCLLLRAVVVIGTVSIAILFSTLGPNGQGSLELPRYDGHLSVGSSQGGESWREEDEGGIRPSTRSG